MLVCSLVCLPVIADDSKDSEIKDKSINELYEEENTNKTKSEESHILDKRSIGVPKGSGLEVSFFILDCHWLTRFSCHISYFAFE